VLAADFEPAAEHVTEVQVAASRVGVDEEALERVVRVEPQAGLHAPAEPRAVELAREVAGEVVGDFELAFHRDAQQQRRERAEGQREGRLVRWRALVVARRG
jgi:hypothetical protein